jgi:cystathionine beta-lyase
VLHVNDFDALTVEQLRALGGVKWARYPDALGAFVAEMDFGTAPPVVEALHAAVDTMSFGYLPPMMVEQMAEACAAWQRDRYGWDVAPTSVHPMPDVLRGLEVAIRHYSRPGSPVVLPVPAYMPFLTRPGLQGRDIIEVPMARDGGRWVFDLDKLDRAFAAGGDLLILCNPYNPLGRVFTAEELRALSEVVERHGARVFSDEIHAPLTYPEVRHVPYASLSEATARHTVTALSASKAWNLPGLKCAQMILTNEADEEVWEERAGQTAHGASNLGVVANAAAYASGLPWLTDVLGYLDGNRRLLADLLATHLPEVRYDPPEGTYLAWLDFTPMELGAGLGDFFRDEAGIALIDGGACGEAGQGSVRLNFATPRPILERLVEQMAEAVRRRAPGAAAS